MLQRSILPVPMTWLIVVFLTAHLPANTLGCGGTLTDPTGQIESPDANNDGYYENDVSCLWKILLTESSRIRFSIETIHLEYDDSYGYNYCYDYLMVRNGESEFAPLIGFYCGITPPGPIVSNSNALYIKFVTDGSIVREGFTASYTQIIDGGWSVWGEWGDCSKTCDSGTRTRTRQCDSPAPDFGGYDCMGNSEETETCILQACPVDGVWSLWGQWGDCSKTCDSGTRTRTRQCDSPAPENGGANCTGDPEESETCFLQACSVDGAWGTWDAWGDCSKTCGHGTRTRTRYCDSPAPENGGANCTGNSEEYDPCYCQECPEGNGRGNDCEEAFNQGVDLCGNNSRCLITKYGHKCKCCSGYKWKKATRQCEAAPGANEGRPCCGDCQYEECHHIGKVCSKDRKEYDSVKEMVLDRCQKGYKPKKELAIRNYGACEGPVNHWSEWGDCSVTCGKGLKMKTRTANKELSEKKQKKFPLTKVASCYNAPCPGCPSCNETCLMAQVCEVFNGTAMCRCCSCNNDESDKVCGSVAGGSSETYSSLCVLQRTACITGVGFELISPGPCPTECDLVDKVGYYTIELNGIAYTTTHAVNYTACEGECDNGNQNQCSESGTQETDLVFSCTSGPDFTEPVLFPTSCSCS